LKGEVKTLVSPLGYWELLGVYYLGIHTYILPYFGYWFAERLPFLPEATLSRRRVYNAWIYGG